MRTLYVVVTHGYDEPSELHGAYEAEPAARAAAAVHVAEVTELVLYDDEELPRSVPICSGGASFREDGVEERFRSYAGRQVISFGEPTPRPALAVAELAVMVPGRPVVKYHLRLSNYPTTEAADDAADNWLAGKRAERQGLGKP